MHRFKRPYGASVPAEMSDWARDYARGPHDLQAFTVELGSHAWFERPEDAMAFWLKWGGDWEPL